MACQALGRCRICARKHKIAVFGGEKAQHFFIEKAKLKLIILNTVCVDCIGKIERFVKKMDLDIVFNDYIKEEDVGNSVDEIREQKEEQTIKTQELNEEKTDKSSGPLMAMDVDHSVLQTDKNSRDSKASDASYNSYTSCSNIAPTDTQARRKCSGDSQTVVKSSYHSSGNKIGQGTSIMTESSNEPRRKRPRNVSKINLAEKQVGGKSESVTTPLSSSSAVRSSVSTISFVDCNSSECSSTVKKSGRFLCCDFCKKVFTHAGDLNKHRRKHTGEKPYECYQCKRKFAHASNLARHQRVHSGERPFACPQCARTFTRRDKLAIHINAGRCQINTSTNINPTKSTSLEQTKT